MNKPTILTKTTAYVKQTLENEGSGHDWWHIHRVLQNARLIGKTEKVDMFVVELAALLHDIADWKMHDGDQEIGAKTARKWLKSLDVDTETIDHVYEIIATSSYKGAHVTDHMSTREGEVVQDADRLDAIGTIGIARAFTYGGHKGSPIYDPTTPPAMHTTAEAYYNGRTHTINHFYEKLLLLKDLMKTQTAKKLARARHAYMEKFLKQFYKEWEGEA